MTEIPVTQRTLLVRTDFSDDSAWQSVTAAVAAVAPHMMQFLEVLKIANSHLPDQGEFDPSSISVELLDDVCHSESTPEELLDKLPPEYPHAILFVFDSQSASQADHTLLVIDLMEQRGRTFRTIPSEVQCIDSNLSLSNCDWEDITRDLDKSGVYRGIPGGPV